ncbi:MAG: hypothetical protein FWF22_05720 [Treponema sp.]|nr:hypothetical protein [Treponema sp.]
MSGKLAGFIHSTPPTIAMAEQLMARYVPVFVAGEAAFRYIAVLLGK